MINRYEDYLSREKSISLEQMQAIHHQMLEEVQGDNEALEIYEELVEKATKYAAIRAEWYLWDKATRMERDEGRSSCHNSLIVKFNMLAKYLRLQGKKAYWRDELGYEEDDKYYRKTIGDFACYLVFVNSIHAR